MTSSITPIPHTGIVQLGADRRKAERATTNIPAALRFPDRLQAIQGSICDLSVGGTGFICHQAVAAHAKCSLQFALPALPHSPSHAIQTSVMAINSMQVVGQTHQFRINLQFVSLPPQVRHYIENFIRQSLSR